MTISELIVKLLEIAPKVSPDTEIVTCDNEWGFDYTKYIQIINDNPIKVWSTDTNAQETLEEYIYIGPVEV